MSTLTRALVVFGATASFALFLVSAGCNKTAPVGGEHRSSQQPAAPAAKAPAQPAAAPAAESPAPVADAPAKKPDGAARAASAATPPGLAKLSAEDRALAEKQKTCPVTDEPLGSMGAPVKVSLKGQTVFLCCAGCEEELKKEPDKYLAKLNKSAAK
jgi:YHS domain-containing protein